MNIPRPSQESHGRSFVARRGVRRAAAAVAAAIAIAALGFILTLQPKWQLFAVGAALVFTIVAATQNSPRLWLFLLGAGAAFNFNTQLGGAGDDAGGVVLYATDIPTAVLLLRWVAERSIRGVPRLRAGMDARARLAVTLAGTFGAWVVIASFGANGSAPAIANAMLYARLFLGFAVVSVWARDRVALNWALAGIFCGLAAQSVIAVLQFAYGSSFDMYEKFYEDTASGQLTRSGGTLNPTVLSEFIGVAAPLVLASAFASRAPLVMAMLLGLYSLATVASLMTLSRGGILNLFVTTTIIIGASVFREGVTLRRKLLLVGGVMTTVWVLAAHFSSAIGARIAIDEVTTDAGRVPQMRQALAMTIDNPVTGVGLGNYVERMGAYGAYLPYPVHNKFLLVAAETGIPGGILYVAFWVILLTALWSQLRRSGVASSPVLLGCCAALVGSLLNMNTDVYALGGAPEVALLVTAGLGLAANNRLL